MLHDNYILRSNIAKQREASYQNIRTFLEAFNNFYNSLRIREKPSFYRELCDPYGFALMCEDYKDNTIVYDMDLTCKEIFENKAKNEHMDLYSYHGCFTFREILDMLYRGFLFDYKKAINVYRNQHDAFNIFNQIINGNGYIFNREKPELAKSRKATKTAFESIITLDENKPIQVPHIWRLCDGMVAPFIVNKFSRDIHTVTAECHGFGDGIFLLSDEKIIDCLKINDTWFTDLPLEERLKFAFKCTEYEVQEYGKAWSWRSILDVGKMLEANSTNGLLVRGARENFFQNRWFNWSKTSLIYCKKANGQLVAKTQGRLQPDYYTLEGDEGIISPFEEKKYNRMYLDDFDIREFQKIMELK